jgi:hypothetical protein
MDKLKIIDLTNNKQVTNIVNQHMMTNYTNIKLSNLHFTYYNDYNVDNYLVCFIYVAEDNKFDEDLYNRYHYEYLQHYTENPQIKIIVLTNNIVWCKQNLKFFNIYYYYI